MKEKLKYSDGSEKALYQFFLKKKSYNEEDIDWASYYHLTERRKNILSWYDFKKGTSVLEVGAGCGALTGLFLERGAKVTAVEMEPERAKVIKKRYQGKENLEVIVGSIENVKNIGKFDYVTCIGVLEYAGKYNNSKKPYNDFLLKLKSFLKEEGVLITAIENKYGLKYWAGSGEDHTGLPFESIEGYPNSKGVKTFSKKELIKLLESAGFTANKFYYPFPDYKLPNEIFSDDYLPSVNHRLRTGSTPFYDPTSGGIKIFNENLVANNLSIDGYIDIFANSFLVFSGKEKK